MSLPRLNDFLLAILQYVEDGLIYPVGEVYKGIIHKSAIDTPEPTDVSNTLPIGLSSMEKRFHSARSDLIKTELIRKAGPGYIQITKKGQKILKDMAGEDVLTLTALVYREFHKQLKGQITEDQTDVFLDQTQDAEYDVLDRGNAFEMVCKLASDQNWCWSLGCTTCGNTHFRYAFVELARGNVPSDKSWAVSGRITDYAATLGPFPREFNKDQKVKVLDICNKADLDIISGSCRFPDWLGFLGVILHYMSSIPETNAYKNVSQNWADQLLHFIPENSILRQQIEFCVQGKMLLSLRELENIEREISGSESPLIS